MLNSPSSPTFCATNHSLNAYRGPPSRANTSSPRPRHKKSLPDSPHFRPASPLSNPQVKIAPPSPPRSAQTVDSGTQYTPPDWPPTSSRSSLYAVPQTQLPQAPVKAASPHQEIRGRSRDATIRDQTVAAAAVPAPSEPELRVTPQPQLENGSHAVRRSRSLVGRTPGGSPASKRAKAHSPNLVTLPADYWECDAKILASIIADMLMELIRHNDELPLNDGQLTRFHSR